MKLLIYSLIIVMSTSLAFSGGKPCCNKKVGKNVISCKFNHTDLVTDKDKPGKLTTGNSEKPPLTCKSSTADGIKCAKKPWWKFWTKKNTKTCPCKKETVLDNSSTKIENNDGNS